MIIYFNYFQLFSRNHFKKYLKIHKTYFKFSNRFLFQKTLDNYFLKLFLKTIFEKYF